LATAEGKVRREGVAATLFEEAEEELRVIYTRLPPRLSVRIDARDTETFWRLVDDAISPTFAGEKKGRRKRELHVSPEEAVALDAQVRAFDANPGRAKAVERVARALDLDPGPSKRRRRTRLTAEDRADLKIAKEGSRQLREHPKTMISSEEMRRHFGMKPAPKRQRWRKS